MDKQVSTNLFDEILKAKFNFDKTGVEATEVHMTKDFQLRLVAQKDYMDFYDHQTNNFRDTILGYPLKIHKSADRPFWFEPNEIAIRYEDFR